MQENNLNKTTLDDTQSMLIPSSEVEQVTADNENLSRDTKAHQNLKHQSSSDNHYLSPLARRIFFQVFIFSLTFMNYAVLHATRAAWSNATPQIEHLYGFDAHLISYMNSTFLFCYAFFGIFSGHFADRFPKNRFIFCTYTIIGLNVIFVGCQQYFNKQQIWLYFILRIIDGTIQSIGWATNLAVLSNWFPKHGRGLLIGCWASNANVGDIIGAQIYKTVTKNDGSNWGTGIIIVGALVVITGVINLFGIIENPSTKNIVIQENSHLFHKIEETSKEVPVEDQKSINFIQALLIPGVLLFSISFFFIKFSMYGFYYWLPNYLQDGLGYSKDTSANIFSLFSTGSIVGNVLMGLFTDFLPYRSPVFIFGILFGTIMTLALTLWNNNGVVLISIFMFFLGSSLSGSTIVIAAIECDLGKQQILKQNARALATVSGIIDGIAGFGSIVGQLLIGIVKEKEGWRSTFVMLTIGTALSAVPAVFFTKKEYQEWKEKKQLKQQEQQNELSK